MTKDYGQRVSKEWLNEHKHYTLALLLSYGGTAINALIAWLILGRGSMGLLLSAVIFAALTVWSMKDKRLKSRGLAAVLGAVAVLLCVTLYFFVYKLGCRPILLPLAAECSVMLAYAILFKKFDSFK